MGLLQEKLAKYDLTQQYMAMGVYPYFREIEGKQGTEVNMGGHKVLMFGSNAYTGLTGDERVIEAGIKAMKKYGSGCAGSRFLIGANELDLDFLLLERKKELASELIRRTDLIRFGKYTKGNNWDWKNGVRLGEDVDDKYNLFPIPESELTNNPTLVQNDGYKVIK